MKKRYEVESPDFTLSPFTGMTKKHYAECAKFLLEKAFTHVKSMDDPISFPTVPGKTYPQPGAPLRAPCFSSSPVTISSIMRSRAWASTVTGRI